MTEKLKKDIETHLTFLIGPTTKDGLPVSQLVKDIAYMVDKEFTKVITETCELGPMLEAVGLEIRSKDNA